MTVDQKENIRIAPTDLISRFGESIKSVFKPINLENIVILETGTARGFSSLCMAKALNDSKISGSILTFDVLPHTKKIYWNCITDHLEGPITRQELLEPWKQLVNNYIIFHQGYSNIELKKIGLQRINFAFLDGSHTYKDVLFENLNTKIKTDKIEFDLVTKNIQMTMDNKKNKINLVSNY